MFDLGSAVGYLELDTSGFQKGFKDAKNQMKTFSDETAKFSDKMGAVGGIMTNVGGTLTKYVTGPLVGAGTAFVAFASEGETAMSQFQAKVGDVTGSMEDYKDVMEDIYKNNYGEDMMDVANAMGEVVNRLGEMDGKELQNVTESALALRDTFEYEINESIRTVDTLMKNFGLTSEEAFDYIVKGTQEGLDYSGEFLDTINEYSVQFEKLGFSAEDMFAILKEGADSGAWNLDKIGDAIKEFSIRAIDGSNTTIQGFELLGFSADDMAQKFAAGGDTAKEAFNDVIKAIADMDDPVQQSIAGVDLFGTMWEDLGPDVVTQLADITGGAIDMKGAMDDLKDVKYDNLGSALEGLGRSLKVAGASLGEYLIPKVEAAIGFVDGLVEKFDGLDDGTKEMIVNIGLVAAAIGPVLLIGGKIITGVSSLISAFSTLGPIIAGLSAPIGIVVAAIAALALAWTTNFGGIRDATASIFESISTIISEAWSFIQSIWESNFLNIQGIFTAWWENFELYWGMVFDTIAGIFEVFALAFQGDWEGAWDKVKEIASNIWDTVKKMFSNFLDAVIDTLLSIASSLWDAAKTVFNKVKEGFEWVWDEITEWFNRVIEDPVGTVLGIGSSLFDAGKSIFNSLWDGLKSIWEDITDWVSDGIEWIVDKVKFWDSEKNKVDKKSVELNSSGSYASGLDYVPRTMNVTVHEGERILTKEENKNYGKQRAMMLNLNVTFTHAVDSNTAKKVSKELARETAKELRGKGVALA